MGLDTVELVMEIEKEFELEIPDEAASNISTVGEMHSWLLTELQRLGRPKVDSAQVYGRLRELICHQLGVKPEAVVPSARFVKDLGAD